MLFTVFICVLVVACLAVSNAGLLRTQSKEKPKPKPKPPKEAPIIMAFQNQEKSNNMEYHCMSPKRDYVRGTYGMRGYFEGKVVDNNAFVNFWEITVKQPTSSADITLVPSSGSAVISYSKMWDSADGPFWNSGSSNITDSYGMWGATEGACAKCVKGFDTGAKLSAFRLGACLWSDTKEAQDWKTSMNYGSTVYGTPGVSYNTWSSVGVGNEDKSALTGAYKYTYTPALCEEWGYNCTMYGYRETGNYGLNTISANIASGQVFASEINIRSGPVKGMNYDQVKGSGIYVAYQKNCEMQYYYNSTEGWCQPKSGLIGFFCTLSPTAGLYQCGSDYGDSQTDSETYMEWGSYYIMRDGYMNDWNMYKEGLGTFNYMASSIQTYVSNNNGFGFNFKAGEEVVSVESFKKLEAEASLKLVAEILGKK